MTSADGSANVDGGSHPPSDEISDANAVLDLAATYSGWYSDRIARGTASCTSATDPLAK
jgi:hypothetical protein